MRIKAKEKELLVLIVFCNCLVKALPCDGMPDTIEYDGKCYEFKNTEKSYASAQEFCNGKGGILLEITNDGIENFVYETISNLGWSWSYMYIGFNKTTGKNPWLRQNGDEITYEDWLTGQEICWKPMEYLCTANCVLYDFSFKGWSDTHCEEEYHYACEYG
ncbi:Hypothetical predicted protein [Mytilus galloprovincialis]|uniref:C-type lectin domain-containing protein n=1 Tax=Mytilus galloprovincialis TaxID=29158 RepID=A0A8B6GQ24_MYTGA|nr:Hypothetical predicted protein [Mytilus galloprovincialis]